MAGKKFELNEDTLSVIEEIGGHMPGGFFIYKANESEELIYANSSVLNIYGCSGLEEFKKLTGFTVKGMVHPDDYQRISQSVRMGPFAGSMTMGTLQKLRPTVGSTSFLYPILQIKERRGKKIPL